MDENKTGGLLLFNVKTPRLPCCKVDLKSNTQRHPVTPFTKQQGKAHRAAIQSTSYMSAEIKVKGHSMKTEIQRKREIFWVHNGAGHATQARTVLKWSHPCRMWQEACHSSHTKKGKFFTLCKKKWSLAYSAHREKHQDCSKVAMTGLTGFPRVLLVTRMCCKNIMRVMSSQWDVVAERANMMYKEGNNK